MCYGGSHSYFCAADKIDVLQNVPQDIFFLFSNNLDKI